MNSNGSVYKHWNVFFKDIFRVGIDVLNKDNLISSKEFQRAFDDEGGGNPIKNMVYFVLKIHFMMNDEPQGIKYSTGLSGNKVGISPDESGSMMAGLRVARRDIKAKTKDFQIIKRILRTL